MNSKTAAGSNIDEKRKRLLLARQSRFQEIAEFINLRNKFYRDNNRFLIGIWILMFFTLILLCIVIYFAQFKEIKSFFIQAKINGEVITSESITSKEISGKEITDQQVVDWALQAIPKIYNYHFLDPEANSRTAITLFTPSGYKVYRSALDNSKLLVSVNKTSTVSLALGCGNKTEYIQEQKVRNIQGYPVYSWTLKIPYVARNIATEKRQVSVGYIYMGIQRVPQIVSASGMAIWQFIFNIESEYAGDAKFTELCDKYFGTT